MNSTEDFIKLDVTEVKDDNEYSEQFSDVYNFDLTKIYPENEISIQSIAEVEYIPLETRDDMLMRRRDTKYMDENEIVATNGKDVMFFNRNGAALYSFNHSGGSGEEYSEISSLAYDRENEEIFILDRLSLKRVRVYAKDGKFKRSFSVSSQKGNHVYGILSVDNNSLVCYSPKEPALLISKKNGSIIKILQTSVGEPLELMIRGNLRANTMYPFFGKALNGYILTDLSSDSTYVLTSDNNLKSFSFRKPAIHKMAIPVFLLPCLETLNYYFASTIKKEYNFEKKLGFPCEYLMYDKVEKKIYTQKLFNLDYTNKEYIEIDEYSVILPSNQYVISLGADRLIEEYRNNNLKGELKKVASGLRDDDNPVLMLIKFK